MSASASAATARRPAKRAKLLADSDDSDSGGALRINEAYAQRFEHNKKREERHRLEDKYGAAATDGSDDSEDEDDAGELATERLDAEISATLRAIRSKDPRVYDKSATFYRPGRGTARTKPAKEKPMTLKEYHTKALLEGSVSGDEAPLASFAQEQEELRQNVLRQVHAADGSDDDDGFLVAKPKPAPREAPITELNVDEAEKDPDTFLSNFMASRAWVPTAASRFQPLESDDEEDEARAEDFEEAYNLYFEDPSATNEKLVTYARDAVAGSTVRREEASVRRRARDAARAKRDAERQEREGELHRLRKLKVEELGSKVERIRKTAGWTGRDVDLEEWTDVLDADWSDGQWDEEMRKRFGESYYAEGEALSKAPKKPKWDEDIAVDLPGLQESEPPSEDERQRAPKRAKRDRKPAGARRDRRLIESLVDSTMEYDARASQAGTQFRYRATSPVTFGLMPQDILLAEDAQLNQFAGLKKLAAFRDPAKKKKDRKSLSKKARLRQWRKDTFGDAHGPGGLEQPQGLERTQGLERGLGGEATMENGQEVQGERKTRRRKRKATVKV